MTSRHDPTLERLRAAYQDLPHDHMRDLTTLLEHAHARYRARRQTKAALNGTAAAVGVAGILIATTQLGTGDPSPGPSTAVSSPTSGESAASTTPGVPEDVAAAVDELYPRLDAIPSLGYYTIEPQNDRVVLWGDLALDRRGLTAAAQEVTDQTGVRVELRPLEEAPTPTAEQQDRLTNAATEIKNLMREHPEVGYSTLRIEAHFDQLILWRATPDADVDRAIEQIALDAGITLELRVADYSQAQAQAVLRELTQHNDQWSSRGFKVVGGAIRPTGVIVNIDGNLEAAQRELLDESGVLAVSNDSEEPVPLDLS